MNTDPRKELARLIAEKSQALMNQSVTGEVEVTAVESKDYTSFTSESVTLRFPNGDTLVMALTLGKKKD
jgi:hypothetical protein